VAQSGSSGARTLVTLVMDVLVAVAVMVLTHLVFAFFGTVAASSWGKGILGITGMFVLPLGIDGVRTPYAGVFKVDAAATIMVLLVAEWLLGLVRRNA
jgi:hypothetical protein